MLSREEFNRQLKESLASTQTKEEATSYAYLPDKPLYNTRLDKDTMDLYNYEFKKYMPLYIISIPFCMIFALAASLALVLLGVIKTTFLLWTSTILMFVILYGGILVFALKKTTRKIELLNKYDVRIRI